MAVEEGALFRKFRVVAELDSGGMADVYLCVARGPAGFSKLHVIKKIKRELARQETFVRMFLDEARLAARLEHPNVVHTHEVGQDGQEHYLVMEYLEGQSLGSLLRAYRKQRGAPLPLHLYLRALCEAMAGLHYAHELKDFDGSPLSVVHRDVSPQNVFITYSGSVKLLDFGIAKAAMNSVVTQTGELKGKVAYMSPEQVLSNPIDRRADIWAVGAMIWDAAVGKRLWAGMSDVTKIKQICSGVVPRPSAGGVVVAPELERICMKALAPDPADRYPTMQALRADVEAFLVQIGATGTAEDLGSLTAELFSEERQRIRTMVGDHIRRLDAEPQAELAPIVLASEVPPSVESSRLLGMTPPPATSVTLRAASPGVVRRPRKLGVAVAGALALAVIGGLLLDRTRSKNVSQPAAASPARETPDTVAVDIRVSPTAASLSIDGQPLGANPFVGRRPRGGSAHHLEIRLPDGRSETRPLAFDRDVLLEITLDERPRAGAGATAPSVGTPATKTGATRPQPQAPHAATRPSVATPTSEPHKAEPAAAPTSTGKQKPRPELDKIDL